MTETKTNTYLIRLAPDNGQHRVEGMYHAVVADNAPAWFYVKDKDHKVMFASPADRITSVTTLVDQGCDQAGHLLDKTRWLVIKSAGGLLGPNAEVPGSVNPCARCGVWVGAA